MIQSQLPPPPIAHPITTHRSPLLLITYPGLQPYPSPSVQPLKSVTDLLRTENKLWETASDILLRVGQVSYFQQFGGVWGVYSRSLPHTTLPSFAGPPAREDQPLRHLLGVYFDKKAPPHVETERSGEDGSGQNLFRRGGGKNNCIRHSKKNHFHPLVSSPRYFIIKSGIP